MKVKSLLLIILLCSAGLKAQEMPKCLQLIRYGKLEEASACASTMKPAASETGIKLLIETQVAMEKGDTSMINKIYESEIGSTASDIYSVCSRILLFISRNELEKAKAVSGNLLANHKNAPLAILTETAGYFISYKYKDPSHTLDWIKQLEKEKYNTKAEFHLLKGDYCSSIGDHGTALNHYNSALDIEGEKSIVHFKKAIAYKNIRNYNASLEELEAALSINKEFPLALHEKSEVLFDLKQNESAIAAYKEYLKAAPYDIHARLKFGTRLYSVKDFQGAYMIAGEVNSIQPSNISALKLMGYSLYELGKYEEGLNAMKTYLEKTDSSVTTAKDMETMAQLYSKSGNDSLAIHYYSLLAERPDARPEQLSDAGGFLMKKSKYSKAFDIYQTKLSRHTGSSTDYFNFGRAALALERYEIADSMLAKVCELQPTWPNGYLFRANANAHLDPGTTEGRALPYYQKYVELAEADTANLAKYKTGLLESHRYLAYYYFLKKDIEKSKASWKRVLEIEPNDRQAKEALKQL